MYKLAIALLSRQLNLRSLQNRDKGSDILISSLLFRYVCSTQERVARVDDYLPDVLPRISFSETFSTRLLFQKTCDSKLTQQSSRNYSLGTLHNGNTTQ